MRTSTLSDGRRWSTAAVIGLLALGGAGALAVGIAGQQSPPSVPRASVPVPAAAEVGPSPVPSAAAPAQPVVSGPVLPESRPVAVSVPSIGARSPQVVDLGLQSDRTMEVPADFDLAGWYVHGPTPGELGPAVLAGHVDSAEGGPAVFFRLGELQPGAEVLVERADGSTAVFAVDRVERYAKDDFPTLEVYGDTDHAALRLITCGGAFDDATGHYLDNVVAYAHLVDVRPA